MEYSNQKVEEFNKFLDGKKVAIIGMGVSNLPLLDYFYNKNAKVTVFDKKVLPDETMEKINKYRYEFDIGDECLSKLNEFDIIFRSPSALPTMPELAKAVEQGAILTSEIEMVLKLAPCKIIGVTGTEGKTTTTSIIAQIIEKAGYRCFVGGNIGKPIFTQMDKVTPEDVIVLELSSFQLMNMEVSPDIAVVTNIYPDHLNVHKTYEEYQEAKKNIFKHQSKDNILILNNDNYITKSFEAEAPSKVIFFSSKEKLQDGYIYDREDGKIKLINNGNQTNIIDKKDIKLRGIHNYENICAALAATSALADVGTQISAIKEFKGVEHRLEFVREKDGVKYYNDSIGTSPASTIAGLNAFDENIVLLAGGSDKGLDYTEVGENIARKVGTLILTGPTADKIEEATNRALQKLNKNIDILHCKNLEEAVNLSKTKAKSGDVVLLSPASASFDAFKNFMERGEKFKKLVNEL